MVKSYKQGHEICTQEVEVSLSEWELGVASGLKDMKEKLSLCEVRDTNKFRT